jgi:hypothetical protein
MVKWNGLRLPIMGPSVGSLRGRSRKSKAFIPDLGSLKAMLDWGQVCALVLEASAKASLGKTQMRMVIARCSFLHLAMAIHGRGQPHQ